VSYANYFGAEAAISFWKRATAGKLHRDRCAVDQHWDREQLLQSGDGSGPGKMSSVPGTRQRVWSAPTLHPLR